MGWVVDRCFRAEVKRRATRGLPRFPKPEVPPPPPSAGKRPRPLPPADKKVDPWVFRRGDITDPPPRVPPRR